MKLTTRSRYGARMILDIAQHGQNGPVRIKDIAERQDISVKYLEKLVRDLKRAGYVVSRRGPRGGHQLAKPLEAISIGEIVSALEGDMGLVDCIFDHSECRRGPSCPTRAIWLRASKALMAELDSISLADMVAAHDRDGATPEE